VDRDTPVEAESRISHPGSGAPCAEDAPPRRFGRYQVNRLLGAGTFGKVYAAHDPLLDRPVALKVVQPDLDAHLKRTCLDRFRVELRVFGRVTHPHVVSVFDACLTGETPFLVMELCSGPTLSRWRARYPKASPGQAAAIFHQAALALDHIHAMGIVHRDIKPSNFLFHHKKLKLTDFGIARADFIPFEEPPGIHGTPGYMPPEQYAGEGVTARSDLFALAAVLYELLTGQVPFPGDPTSITYARVFEEPPSALAVAPDLPPDFDDFFAQALAPNPEDRFPSAADMVAALARIVPEDALESIATTTGEGQSLAPPPPTGFRYGRTPRRTSGFFPGVPPREPPPPPAPAGRVMGAVPAPWTEDASPFGTDVVPFENGSPRAQLLRAAHSVVRSRPFPADHEADTLEIGPPAPTDPLVLAVRGQQNSSDPPSFLEENEEEDEKADPPHAPVETRSARPATLPTSRAPAQSVRCWQLLAAGLVGGMLVSLAGASAGLTGAWRTDHTPPAFGNAPVETPHTGVPASTPAGAESSPQAVSPETLERSPGTIEAPATFHLRILPGNRALHLEGTLETGGRSWVVTSSRRSGRGQYLLTLEPARRAETGGTRNAAHIGADPKGDSR